MRISVGRIVALVSGLALGGDSAGCSFVFVEGVPSDHAKSAYFDCTSTYGLSVADGLIALGGGIGAGTALSQSKQDYADKNSGASRNAAAGVDIALAGLLAGSAVYGVVQATRCDHAKEELKARIFAAPLRPLSPDAASQPPPALPAPALSFPPISPTPSPSAPPTPVPVPAAPTP